MAVACWREASQNETRRKTFGAAVWRAKHGEKIAQGADPDPGTDANANANADPSAKANASALMNEVMDDMDIDGLDDNDWSEAAALAETITVGTTPALQADAMLADWGDLDGWNGAPAANVPPAEEPAADAETVAALPPGAKIQV